MKYFVCEAFSVETQQGRTTVPPGKILELSEYQAAKLTAYIIPAANEARRLMQEIAARDPGGNCWAWVQANRPDLWRSHLKALHNDDITAARLSFNGMIDVWNHRHEQKQDDLMS